MQGEFLDTHKEDFPANDQETQASPHSRLPEETIWQNEVHRQLTLTIEECTILRRGLDETDDELTRRRWRDTWDGVVKRIQPVLLSLSPGICMRIVGRGNHGEVAEEAVQITLIKLFQRAGYLDPRRHITTSFYILRMLRNTIIDLNRSLNRPTLDTVELNITDYPSSDTEQEPLKDRLYEAMATLSEPKRQVMFMVAAGFSNIEIAAIIGVPLTTIKGRRLHAQKQIRAYFRSLENPEQASSDRF